MHSRIASVQIWRSIASFRLPRHIYRSRWVVGTKPPYPIVHAEHINTRYSHSVPVAILDSPTSCVKNFLPRRYGDVVSGKDLQAINSQRVALFLIYKWTSRRSNSKILELKR